MTLKSTQRIDVGYIINDADGNRANVTFVDLTTEGIFDVKDDEGKVIATDYVYDAFTINIRNDESYINENYSSLLEKAKQSEYDIKANEVRTLRNKYLEDTDIYALSDRDMSEAMREYRQALRDVTKQSGFPYDVVFPVKPEN